LFSELLGVSLYAIIAFVLQSEGVASGQKKQKQETPRYVSIKFDESYTLEEAAILPDGSGILVIGGRLRRAEPLEGLLHDLTGKRTGKIPVAQHTVRNARFSPDGKLLGILSQEGLEVIEFAARKRRFMVQGDFVDFAYSPDGTSILAGSALFSASDGRQLWESEDFSNGCFADDGKTIIARGLLEPFKLKWFDVRNGEELKSKPWKPPREEVTVLIDPHPRWVSPQGAIVYLVDMMGGRIIPVPVGSGEGRIGLRLVKDRLKEVAGGPWLTRDGKLIAGLSMRDAGDDMFSFILRMWKTLDWSESEIVLEPKSRVSKIMDLSRDGRYFLLGVRKPNSDEEIRIYTLE